MFDKSSGPSRYAATDITVLNGLEAVRKRPGMYIGDTADGTGLHNVLFDVVDNAIAEALAGFATELAVTLNVDGSVTIRDDGRGMPTDLHPKEGISAEVMTTQLCAGSIFQDYGNPYRSHYSLGLAVVSVLSERLDVTIWRNGSEHRVRFRNGIAEAPLQAAGPARGRHGTEITFWPSLETFRNVTQFDYPTLERRMRELAFLIPGVRVVLRDDRQAGSKPQVMRYPDGVADFVRHLDRSSAPLLDAPITICGERGGISVELALWWNDTRDERVLCFTNNIPQRRGGTHLAGFHAALVRIVAEHASGSDIAVEAGVDITGDDVREGLTAVLSVKVPYFSFSSQTTDRLVSPEVRPAVESIVADGLAAWLDEHPDEAEDIVRTVVEAAQARNLRAVARHWTPGAASRRLAQETPGSTPVRSNPTLSSAGFKSWEERSLQPRQPGLAQSESDDTAGTLMCRGGSADLVRQLDRARTPLLAAPIVILADRGDAGMDVEVALWWNDGHGEQVLGFTDGIPQRDGGTHLAGFHAGLGRVIAQRANAGATADSERVAVTGDDARQGLTGVVAIWMRQPSFSDETRSELISPEVRYVVESLVADRVSAWLDAHPDKAQAVLAKARMAASGRAIGGFARRPPAWRPT